MSTNFPLANLRGRLASVKRRILDATLDNPLRHNYLYAAGQLIELRSEQEFLTGLISGLEKSAATRTDSEKLAMIYAHIDAEIQHLTEVICHHRANITEPDIEQQADYLMALGERRALMELSHKLMEVQP